MDLAEKKMIGLNFEISISPKSVVNVKEMVGKYAKEIGLELYQEKVRDSEGELKYALGLKGFVKPTEAKEGVDILVGLLEDIFREFAGGIDEERVHSLNTNYLTITEGKSLELEGTKSDKIYYVRHFGEGTIVIYAEIEELLKLEDRYDKLVRKVFAETPTEWYERNVETLGKRFPKKQDFESAKAIVDIFENKTNVKKVKHKKIKWRFSFE